MTQVTYPVELVQARDRMAKARAARMAGKYPADVEARIDIVRQLVIRQFKDAGLSAVNDGRLVGGPSARYFYTKLTKGTLTIKDMILLGDYMPVDWTLIFKSIRQAKDVLRPVDGETDTIDVAFSEPSDNPFADFFTDVDGA